MPIGVSVFYGGRMKVLGIDPSLTSTGVCRLNRDQYEVSCIKIKGSDGVARLWALKQRVLQQLQDFRPDLVVIEGYSFGSKGRGVFQLAEWGGVLRLALYESGFRTLEVPPTSLKKYVTGKGNSPKEQMILGAYKKFGVEFASNDECDAYCLARLGRDVQLNGLDVPHSDFGGVRRRSK